MITISTCWRGNEVILNAKPLPQGSFRSFGYRLVMKDILKSRYTDFFIVWTKWWVFMLCYNSFILQTKTKLCKKSKSVRNLSILGYFDDGHKAVPKWAEWPTKPFSLWPSSQQYSQALPCFEMRCVQILPYYGLNLNAIIMSSLKLWIQIQSEPRALHLRVEMSLLCWKYFFAISTTSYLGNKGRWMSINVNIGMRIRMLGILGWGFEWIWGWTLPLKLPIASSVPSSPCLTTSDRVTDKV